MVERADLEKEDALRKLCELPEGRAAALAFSGGVDSSYLLAVALEALGRERLVAYLGVSPSLSKHQREQAHAVARFLDAPLEEVSTDELERPEYRANRGDRCFFCKDTLFRALASRSTPGTVLFEGTNLGDLGGHRPGWNAGQLHGVRSPLVEARLDKAAIRRLSRKRGLPTADLPASPCLASRVPAGTAVDQDALARIEAAEAVLRSFGLREFRVRHHGELARLEISTEEMAAFTALDRIEVDRRIKSAGYRHVTLDLAGFRSGNGSQPREGATEA